MSAKTKARLQPERFLTQLYKDAASPACGGARRITLGAQEAVRLSGTAATLLACIWLGLVLPGCRCPAPQAASQPAIPATGNAALMEYVGDQPFVTAEAGYRAAYILWKGEPFAGDFDALTDQLEAEGIIGKAWKLAPDAFLDRAAVGHMVCRACGIRSGLNWQLTGLGRYAWRELQYKNIAGPGSEWGLVSGGEFLGILARADDYMRRAGARVGERAELGNPP